MFTKGNNTVSGGVGKCPISEDQPFHLDGIAFAEHFAFERVHEP
jgi:hypothetical protein